MKNKEYLAKRDELVSFFSGDNHLKDDEKLGIQFNLVSASLLNYLPEIAFPHHEDIYKNILLHQHLSRLEESFYGALDYVTCENLNKDIRSVLRYKPSIICTFHTGSYRVINLWLTKQNIPYVLVIARNVIAAQSDRFLQSYNQLPGSYKAHSFSWIDAESPSSGLKMLREIKNGKNLLLYIDGNTGSGSNTMSNHNHLTIDFFARQIFARKGIALLAHIAHSPIITVASYRKSMADIRLRFFDPLFPDAKQERAAFAKATTQKIYNMVAPIIKAHPHQWEGWMYLHKSAHIPVTDEKLAGSANMKPVACERVLFNSAGFGIFKIEDNAFLFQKNNYRFYPVNKSLYHLLSGCMLQPVSRKNIESGLFSLLYAKKVLVSV